MGRGHTRTALPALASTTAADVAADGTILAASPDGLIDVANATRVETVGDGTARLVAASATGSLVAVVRSEYSAEVEIWDLARRTQRTSFRLPRVSEIGWAFAFSPDERLLAAGGLDPVVSLWDTETGEPAGEITHNVGVGVWSLEFSPDGRVLAMSGGDGVASLWDVSSLTQIGPRLGIGGQEATLDLSPDGRQLLVTHGDGRGVVWDIDADSWARRACGVAHRTLTPEEWEEFLPGRPYDPAC